MKLLHIYLFVSLAGLAVLCIGLYKWSTSDLYPTSGSVRPPIESGDELEFVGVRSGKGSQVDPGTAPWETQKVQGRLERLVPAHAVRWRAYAQLEYVPLSDVALAGSTLRSHWEGARMVRISGRSASPPTPAARDAMADLTLQSLAYLSGEVQSFDDVRPSHMQSRRFKSDAMPGWLFDSYRFVFGDGDPFEVNDDDSKHKVMQDFFNVRREARFRGFLLTEIAASDDGFVGAFYWLGSARDNRQRLLEVLNRKGEAAVDYWAGSLSNAGMFITEAQPTLGQMIQRDGGVLWAEAYIVVRSGNNDRFPMRVGAYHDPKTNRWHLAEINYFSSPMNAGGPATIW